MRLRKNTLIIECDCYFKKGHAEAFYKNIKKQMRKGLVILPPGCRAKLVPKNIKVEMAKGEEHE